ncbi:hypothetical protein Pla110_17830 [Polystyrenella longa]|uniref:DUF1206 domain-containing protein n=1 Tax=Polystyrenella longa TaxID=2528007 RepID=A0A518CLF7_9PLAN|nr:DUF1206 domain-containing protein [Polystyrenella longa]QDU80061.1 hypothetical protein Pla110_17830 [Polystyrenella longa]
MIKKDPSSESEEVSWQGFVQAPLPEMPHWVKLVGRAGHIAKGLVYFIVGLLAFKLAIGAGGELSGAKGAIREIGQQRFGQVLLMLTAVGLFNYTLWRWVQAWKDTEGAGSNARGFATRLGFALNGLVYAFLGVFAATLALGFAFPTGLSSDQTKSILESIPGRVSLGAAGVIVIGVAIYLIYLACRAKFMGLYDFATMSVKIRTTALCVGRIGLVTRGCAFAIIGYFLIDSAILGTNDGHISGMSDALAAIAMQSYGKVLLAITGIGLMCYAVHVGFLGWFRRFNVSDL